MCGTQLPLRGLSVCPKLIKTSANEIQEAEEIQSLLLLRSTHSLLSNSPLSPLPSLTSFLHLPMASDNLSTISGADDENYGFRREEMYQSNLAGTVSAYDRHVFLCYKTPEAWPSHLEASDSDVLPRLLSAALKARKDDISLKVWVGLIDVVFFSFFFFFHI